MDDRVRTNVNIDINKRTVGIDNRHAARHQRFTFVPPHYAIDGGKFLARVDSQHFVGVFDLESSDLLAILCQDSNRIGQVKLALGVIGPDFRQRFEQHRGIEDVNARIDFTNLQNFRARIAMLNDGIHLIVALPNNAAITVRIRQLRRQN